MECVYNISVFRRMVDECFESTQDFKIYLKASNWAAGSSWWLDRTVDEREQYTKYYEREKAAYNFFYLACALVDVNSDALISVIKSISRYEKNHGRYDRNISMPQAPPNNGFLYSDRYERYKSFTNFVCTYKISDDGLKYDIPYYRCTGRRDNTYKA